VNADVTGVLATLERHGTKATRDGMARYGIVAPKAFGVTMADMKLCFICSTGRRTPGACA
jgi:hypothetical protein